MELDSFCLKLTDISLFVRADRSLLRENGKALQYIFRHRLATPKAFPVSLYSQSH